MPVAGPAAPPAIAGQNRWPESCAGALQRAKLGIIADIVSGIIELGRKYEQDRIARELILGPPDHRWQVHPFGWRVEDELVAMDAIVRYHVAAPGHAHQELM